jgi:membrane protein
MGRALQRFVKRNGIVLSGGIAYASIASIAAGLVLVVSLASLIVTGNDRYRQAVMDFIATSIPGVFPTDDQPGLIDPTSIRPTAITGVVGLVALGVLAYAAMRYLRALRAGVRTMLGVAEGSDVPGLLRDVIALLGLLLIAVLGTAMQVISGALAQWVASALGDGGVSSAVVRGTAFSVGLAANIAFVALVFVVLGRARVHRRFLVATVLATAFAIAVLQQASTLFVASAAGNPVLAPFAAVIALLVFVDFVARVLLVGAAWLGATAQPHERDGAGDSISVVEDEIRPRRRNHITTRRAMRRERP